jgi:hypothetical protein
MVGDDRRLTDGREGGRLHLRTARPPGRQLLKRRRCGLPRPWRFTYAPVRQRGVVPVRRCWLAHIYGTLGFAGENRPH